MSWLYWDPKSMIRITVDAPFLLAYHPPLVHEHHELVEEVCRLVGSRRRLGVVLDAEGLEFRVAEPLGGAVVEVVEDRHPPLWERLRDHHEPMVLGGDLD